VTPGTKKALERLAMMRGGHRASGPAKRRYSPSIWDKVLPQWKQEAADEADFARRWEEAGVGQEDEDEC
jgi:hypothetical protein